MTITDLELRFAQNPTSDAYIPLCEAYIDQGRFMEALVVSKKGLKAHADSLEAHLLLAQVYAAQKKYPRALKQLDQVVEKFSDQAPAFLKRGTVRDASGDESGAIEDWKKAVDLDPNSTEATEKLAGKGIEYPEKAPEPEPVAPAHNYAAGLGMNTPMPSYPPGGPVDPALTPLMRGQTTPSGGAPPASMPPGLYGSGAVAPARGDTAPSGSVPPAMAAGGAYDTNPPGAMPTHPPGVAPLAFSDSSVPPGYAGGARSPSFVARQRLEGEEELEELASQVAAQKEERGNPKVTLILAPMLLLILVVSSFVMWSNKTSKEAMDRLTQSARAQFAQDTYRGYLKAASLYDDILTQHDEKHPLTNARLAHTLAILWGEHGETTRQAELDAAITRARTHAPNNSDTVAATALRTLYEGKDRLKSAADAHGVVDPFVRDVRQRGGGMSVADMTLGQILIFQGKYDKAFEILAQVTRGMPRSVRAKVLYARAAFRNANLPKAEALYGQVLRGSPDHPGARADRALVRLQRGKLEDADADLGKFDDFVRKHPKDVSERERALFEYAASELARSAGKSARGEVLYESAVRRDPTNADFPYGLGRFWLKVERPKKALPALEKALELEPNRIAFKIALAQAEAATGKNTEALQRIDGVLAQRSKDVDALMMKARILRRTRSPEAKAFHDSLVEDLKTGAGAVRALLARARLLRSTGSPKLALADLEEAIKQIVTSPANVQSKVLLDYASLNDELGNRGVAWKSCEQADTLGDLDGTYCLIRMFGGARGLDRKSRKQFKGLCKKYLGGGALQPNYAAARTMCSG